MTKKPHQHVTLRLSDPGRTFYDPSTGLYLSGDSSHTCHESALGYLTKNWIQNGGLVIHPAQGSELTPSAKSESAPPAPTAEQETTGTPGDTSEGEDTPGADEIGDEGPGQDTQTGEGQETDDQTNVDTQGEGEEEEEEEEGESEGGSALDSLLARVGTKKKDKKDKK